MEKVIIEIKKRNRDYGIITWPYSLDYEVKTLFNLKEHVTVVVGDKTLENRKISYKFRRFSIGKKRIQTFLPSTSKIAIIKENNTYRIKPEE
jgi:hypothetical protein